MQKDRHTGKASCLVAITTQKIIILQTCLQTKCEDYLILIPKYYLQTCLKTCLKLLRHVCRASDMSAELQTCLKICRLVICSKNEKQHL